MKFVLPNKFYKIWTLHKRKSISKPWEYWKIRKWIAL